MIPNPLAHMFPKPKVINWGLLFGIQVAVTAASWFALWWSVEVKELKRLENPIYRGVRASLCMAVVLGIIAAEGLLTWGLIGALMPNFRIDFSFIASMVSLAPALWFALRLSKRRVIWETAQKFGMTEEALRQDMEADRRAKKEQKRKEKEAKRASG